MKVMLIAGARPNFMKIAPILRELKTRAIHAQLVHTGQHYDFRMSESFFQDLGLGDPDFFLDVGSGSHAVQTARIMERFEPVLIEQKPDWVVVVGDVNSTLACALVASKLRAEIGCRIAHVEAGLRSHDWRMPEEVNRVLTDRLSDLLLTPSHDARDNLLREGMADDRIVFVGNVMIDTLFAHRERADALDMPARHDVAPRTYALVTLHRPSNVDDRAQVEVLLDILAGLAERMPVVFPMHPRTRNAIEAAGHDGKLDGIHTLEPLGYTEMLGLTANAAVVLTDSGGLQEETTALGVPCVTVREQTERPVTITEGTNRLAPWPLTRDGVLTAIAAAVAERNGRQRRPDGWDGRAAARIADALSTSRVSYV